MCNLFKWVNGRLFNLYFKYLKHHIRYTGTSIAGAGLCQVLVGRSSHHTKRTVGVGALIYFACNVRHQWLFRWCWKMALLDFANISDRRPIFYVSVHIINHVATIKLYRHLVCIFMTIFVCYSHGALFVIAR